MAEEKKNEQTLFDRVIKTVGMKGVMGFVFGSFFVMLYDSMFIEEPAREAISKGQAAVSHAQEIIGKQKKEIEDLKAKLKGCESVCRGDAGQVSQDDVQEALNRSRTFMRGTEIIEAKKDDLSGRFVQIRTAGDTPLYYDPVSKYLIVGLVLDTNNPIASSKSIERFTSGEKQ